jgi:hypothetical protein
LLRTLSSFEPRSAAQTFARTARTGETPSEHANIRQDPCVPHLTRFTTPATARRATASRARVSGVRRFVTHGVFPVVRSDLVANPRSRRRSASPRTRDRTLTRLTPSRVSSRSHRQDHHPRGGVLRHHRQRQGQDSGQRRCASCHSRANYDVFFLRAIRGASGDVASARLGGSRWVSRNRLR